MIEMIPTGIIAVLARAQLMRSDHPSTRRSPCRPSISSSRSAGWMTRLARGGLATRGTSGQSACAGPRTPAAPGRSLGYAVVIVLVHYPALRQLGTGRLDHQILDRLHAHVGHDAAEVAQAREAAQARRPGRSLHAGRGLLGLGGLGAIRLPGLGRRCSPRPATGSPAPSGTMPVSAMIAAAIWLDRICLAASMFRSSNCSRNSSCSFSSGNCSPSSRSAPFFDSRPSWSRTISSLSLTRVSVGSGSGHLIRCCTPAGRPGRGTAAGRRRMMPSVSWS